MSKADIRWKQRFQNYNKALARLKGAVDLASQRKLSELEEQGLIKAFEFTHELAWNVLKDFFENQGETGILGSRDAVRLAFRRGIIQNGETWMEMIKARNQTSRTYDEEIAESIANNILAEFYPEFVAMQSRFEVLEQAS